MVTSETSPTVTPEAPPEVDEEASRAAWAEAARALLLETAHKYRAIVTHKELTDEVQARSGIFTSQRPQHWIGSVLQRVTVECAERGEPNLAALCINTSGSVGDGYSDNVLAATGDRPEDGDRHAAAVRHEC